MHARSLAMGAVGLALATLDGAGAQTCQITPSATYPQTVQALTAQHRGALLFVSEPVFSRGELDTGQSKSTTVFERGCYAIERRLQNERLWFAINNHSEPGEQPVYVGVQLIKLFAPARTAKPLLTAHQNRNRPWYFRGQKISKFDYREWRYSLRDWNAKANDLPSGNTYESRVYPIFKGYWHVSARPKGQSAWDRRDWWKVNEGLATDYQVVLENRLMSFERASEEVGRGIPFYVTVGGAKAMIIRYYSESSEQNSDVRLCFEDCGSLVGLQIEPP